MRSVVDLSTLPYVERECVVQHEGKTFEAGGAFVSPAYVIGYLADNGVLTSWHGKKIGTYHITSTWPIRSFMSTTISQVEATVNSVTYTGRSCGIGMIYRGKAKA